jgi:anti-sigma regulatory factor (Ser/Thr protein kinase)/anti-anti-sigma regulatory factor
VCEQPDCTTDCYGSYRVGPEHRGALGRLHHGALGPKRGGVSGPGRGAALGPEYGGTLGAERGGTEVILQLQRELLPPALPVLPQAQLAAGYWTADGVAGGDWFDVVLLGGGIVAMVVGDVVGHGVAAAAAMAQLRAVLSERLVANTDLGEALAEVDRFAGRTAGLRAATAAVLALDPASGQFQYATCGHPPPLVVPADGSARFLLTTRGGPLGTGSRPVLMPGLLGADELVLLYTDGLLKRPGQVASMAMAELAKVAADARASQDLPVSALTAAERLCHLAVELAAAGSGDDVIALAAHRLTEPWPALQLELPGTLAALRTARLALTSWLHQIGAVAADRAAIQLGIAELILNAAEHAYPADSSGPICLHAALGDDGYVECRIADHGTWRVPGADGDRGRGLMLVEQLLDDVVISHPPQAVGRPRGARGTMVTLRHRLTRPAILAAGDDSPPVIDCGDAPFRVDAGRESGAARATVHGVVDVFSATEFTRELLAASRGGTLPLTVDLTGVSQLASAGVRALLEVRSQLAAHQQPMSFVALPGSSTAFVLDLVQLSYKPGTAPLDSPPPRQRGRRRAR